MCIVIFDGGTYLESKVIISVARFLRRCLKHKRRVWRVRECFTDEK